MSAQLSQKYPKKINLGCGYDIRKDFLNVDLHERHGPDLVADITNLPMLPSGHFTEVVAQDVLEHLERHKVQGALNEWARLTAPEGLMYVRVPSLEHMFKMLFHPANRPADEAAKIVHLMYGTQAYTGDYHLSGFTAAILEQHLNLAGLQICSATILHSWLYDVVARKTARLTDPDEFVHSAYFKVLGRPADDGGLLHFREAMAAGMTREKVLEVLDSSEEGRFLREKPSYLLGT